MLESAPESAMAARDHHLPTPRFTGAEQVAATQAGVKPGSGSMDSGEGDNDFRGMMQRGGGEVLHVGCGHYHPTKLPPMFHQNGWREIRLDIDPEVWPDFVDSVTDMRGISDCRVDAVYSSHNIEHLYPHEVAPALREMHRVLNPAGFTFIVVPDVQEVARHVAEGRLEDMLYLSPMGPIAPLDILYGHRASLADGNVFMAHRTGFTGGTLAAALLGAGFATVLMQRNPAAFSLTAIAFRREPSEDEIATAQAQCAAELPCVLYRRSA